MESGRWDSNPRRPAWEAGRTGRELGKNSGFANSATTGATILFARFGFVSNNRKLEFAGAANKACDYGVGADFIGAGGKIMDDPLIAGLFRGGIVFVLINAYF